MLSSPIEFCRSSGCWAPLKMSAPCRTGPCVPDTPCYLLRGWEAWPVWGKYAINVMKNGVCRKTSGNRFCTRFTSMEMWFHWLLLCIYSSVDTNDYILLVSSLLKVVLNLPFVFMLSSLYNVLPKFCQFIKSTNKRHNYIMFYWYGTLALQIRILFMKSSFSTLPCDCSQINLG